MNIIARIRCRLGFHQWVVSRNEYGRVKGFACEDCFKSVQRMYE